MIKRFFSGFLCIILIAVFILAAEFKTKTGGISVSTAMSKESTKIVIIDAGHGGFDGGAVAFDGTVEKDLNLQIALKFEAILKLYGYETVMVRTEDVSVNDPSDSGVSAKASDIKNRVAIMEKYPQAIFVSIHMNKYQTTQPHGAQVFYAKSDKSDFLAECIQNSVATFVQTDNKRVIKPTTKDIYLLYHATVPSVIAECGFLSNQNDLNNLKTPDYQLKIAFSIANGIIDYYKQEV